MSYVTSVQFRRIVVAALLSAGMFTAAQQQVRADYAINKFDSADEVAAWFYEGWSTAPATFSWDSTVDSAGDPNSGSMKIEIEFDFAAGKEQASFTRQLAAPLDATPAFLFIADVLVSEESPDTPWGDEGYMQLVGRNGDNWDWVPQIADNINSDGVWIPFDKAPGTPNTDLRAITFQLWGGGAQSLQGTTTLWLDNIQFLGDFPEPNQPGDTNGDGQVDIVDLNNVRNNFGSENPPVGDTNGDNVVDITDLNAVRNNFGAGSPVPEPSAVVMLVCGLGGLAIARRRRVI